MIIPIRCFTCNNLIGSKYYCYLELSKLIQLELENPENNELEEFDFKGFKINTKKTANQNTFDILKLRRYCCRRHLLSHTDLVDKI